MRRQRRRCGKRRCFSTTRASASSIASFVQCSAGQDPNTCLTPAQVQAAQKIYAGPHDGPSPAVPRPRAGRRGADRRLDHLDHRLFTHIVQQPIHTRLRFRMFPDAGCGELQLPGHRRRRAGQRCTADVAADPQLGESRLERFKARGGKLIQYAGWSDAAIPPQNGLNYYRKVVQTMRRPDRLLSRVHGARHGALQRRSSVRTHSATAPATVR